MNAMPKRYVCFVHHDQAWFERGRQDEIDTLARRSLAYDARLLARGRLVAANALHTRETARIVRRRAGKLVVTDGPFTETKEQLLGFLLVEADNDAEALEIAAGVPLAETGTIEVRRALDMGGHESFGRRPAIENGGHRPMRYLCIVHHDESWFDRATPDEMKALDRDSLLYDKQLSGRGKLVVAEALQGSRTARLVRVRQRKASVTDGPFAETKEQMIGFLLIEADSMDEAVEIAKGVPLARTGTIEVREAFFVDG